MWIEKDDQFREFLDNHARINEIRRFSNKKFNSIHDFHRPLLRAEDYSKPLKRGEYQFVSGILGISYNPFLSAEASGTYMNFEVPELLTFWTDKLIEVDLQERERERERERRPA